MNLSLLSFTWDNLCGTCLINLFILTHHTGRPDEKILCKRTLPYMLLDVVCVSKKPSQSAEAVFSLELLAGHRRLRYLLGKSMGLLRCSNWKLLKVSRLGPSMQGKGMCLKLSTMYIRPVTLGVGFPCFLQSRIVIVWSPKLDSPTTHESSAIWERLRHTICVYGVRCTCIRAMGTASTSSLGQDQSASVSMGR
ncbi:uncharacterized protein EI97DRAFT_191364 [Westerdykella ornata]|uniref:Uncharacterized protein n=1 Tax=Westerdykella ornata TaxID=318751 RepID=A0A6A6J9B4_WESOR|nr:uncharacterized protein EI97DRAFT_191364 [Westerdykella ornata]KAF2273161.1 hypothetical protein EI97DRAFT_191364 [Westerdykella ornata]